MVIHSKRVMCAIGVLSAALLPAAPAAAGDFLVTPYVWLQSLDGDGDVRSQLWAADADPFELDNYDGGAAASIEARGEKWAFLGSVSVEDVDQEALAIGGGGNVTAEQTAIDAMVGYKITKGGLYVIAGARSLDYTVSLSSPNASDSSDWLDPVVGFWYRADATKWGVSLEGDYGVGGDSDQIYQIASLFYWHFTDSVSLTLGYKALDIHYEDEGAGFRMHVVTKGPLAGLAFRF